jgi:hypothetical protein
MRVTKSFWGTFVVEDEPVRLDGKAAKRFLASVSAGPSESETRTRFLAECDAVYNRSKKTT